MIQFKRILSCAVLAIFCWLDTACQSTMVTTTTKPTVFKLEQIFPTRTNPSVTFAASIIASPLAYQDKQSRFHIIVPVENGEIVSLDDETGAQEWRLTVPTPEGQQAELIATPIIVKHKLVISYQCLQQGERTSHRMVVIDLPTATFDNRFPVLTMAASQTSADGHGTVKFNPPTAYSHSALKHLNIDDHDVIYAAFGNARDIQPFHGWVFAVDLDAWQQQGVDKAIRNVLLTTPEAECPVKMEYGTQEMICGGGVWAPTGPLISANGTDVELFIATGNGQVDLARHDYANALLRVSPKLSFDAECDARLCADFNPLHPQEACLASCKNLFIPRLAPGNQAIKPPYHECDDKDFWECLAWMDYDLGANTPVKVALKNGISVLVQAGKDGGAYLIDAKQLGVQYDRLQIAQLCGSPTDLCKLSWAGMIVTQPVLTESDGMPIILIPTFSADQTNAAGLVALTISLATGKPRLKELWRFPEAKHANALKMFRSHPSFPVLTTHIGADQEAIAWLVDIGEHGTLYGVRATDGLLVAEQKLMGTGRQLSMPIIIAERIYLASKNPMTGQAMIEAFHINRVK